MKHRFCLILLVVSILLLGSANTVAAVELDKPGMTTEAKWWAPSLYPSAEAAVGAIYNLQANFCLWSGAVDKRQLSVDPFGLRLTASFEGVNTSYKWVPNTGGYWVNGRYVPYYGGSNVPVQTPYSEQYTTTVDFSKIKDIDVQYYPNLSRDNKWGLAITYDDSGVIKFRGDSESTIKQLANAFATLAVARGKRIPSWAGSYNYPENSLANEQQARKNLKWMEDSGAVVANVLEGSPMQLAGIQKNDIILKANGIEIKSGPHFLQFLGDAFKSAPEVKVDFEVYRGGATSIKQVILRDFNAGSEAIARSGQAPTSVAKQPVSLGVEVRSLTVEELAASGLTGGLRITGITSGGIAAKSDIRTNDILYEVNGKPVNDLAQLKAILTNETPSSFKVIRDGAVVPLSAIISM